MKNMCSYLIFTPRLNKNLEKFWKRLKWEMFGECAFQCMPSIVRNCNLLMNGKWLGGKFKDIDSKPDTCSFIQQKLKYEEELGVRCSNYVSNVIIFRFLNNMKSINHQTSMNYERPNCTVPTLIIHMSTHSTALNPLLDTNIFYVKWNFSKILWLITWQNLDSNGELCNLTIFT